MKKLSAILVGVSLVAGAVMAAAPVTSVNVVGYVNTQTEAGKFKLLGVTFNKLGSGPMTITDVLGTNGIPDAAVVYFFDGTGYVGEGFIEGWGWDPGTNNVKRADGFWFTSSGNLNLTMAGEAPSVVNGATTTVVLAHGYQMISYPYPVSISISNTALNTIATDADLLYRWSGSNYVGYSFIEGWGWDPSDLTFAPGEGYWYFRNGAGTTNWVEVKPYSSP